MQLVINLHLLHEILQMIILECVTYFKIILCPKDATGPVFACPTKILCVYMHDLCVNANSVGTSITGKLSTALYHSQASFVDDIDMTLMSYLITLSIV